jgi:hypothetical protein
VAKSNIIRVGFAVHIIENRALVADIHPSDFGMEWPENEFFATELIRAAFLELEGRVYDTAIIFTDDNMGWTIDIRDVLESFEVRYHPEFTAPTPSS